MSTGQTIKLTCNVQPAIQALRRFVDALEKVMKAMETMNEAATSEARHIGWLETEPRRKVWYGECPEDGCSTACEIMVESAQAKFPEFAFGARTTDIYCPDAMAVEAVRAWPEFSPVPIITCPDCAPERCKKWEVALGWNEVAPPRVDQHVGIGFWGSSWPEKTRDPRPILLVEVARAPLRGNRIRLAIDKIVEIGDLEAVDWEAIGEATGGGADELAWAAIDLCHAVGKLHEVMTERRGWSVGPYVDRVRQAHRALEEVQCAHATEGIFADVPLGPTELARAATKAASERLIEKENPCQCRGAAEVSADVPSVSRAERAMQMWHAPRGEQMP